MADSSIQVRIIKTVDFKALGAQAKQSLRRLAERAAIFGAASLRQTVPIKTGRLAGSSNYAVTSGLMTYSYRALRTGESFTAGVLTAAGNFSILSQFFVATPYAGFLTKYHPDYWIPAKMRARDKFNQLVASSDIFSGKIGAA